MSELPPEFIYQGHIRRKIVSVKRTGVLAVPGSGKTRPIIDALVELGRIVPFAETMEERYPYGPILVACSGPAIATWMRQLPEWTADPKIEDDITVIVGGQKGLDAAGRASFWRLASAPAGNGIYITNYSLFLRDTAHISQVPWAAVIADEYHKAMRRKKNNKTYLAFKRTTKHVDILIMASGSALRKDPSSMFTLFQAIKPKLFTSYWRFVNTWCIVTDGHFGKEIIGPKNIQKYKEMMDQHLAYVPKEVVADQLPDGRRMALTVELDDEQHEIYHDLKEDMITILDTGTVVVAPNVLVNLIRMRQLLCCPKILDEKLGMGAGYNAIVDKMDDTPHCVIFVPFRVACDYIKKDMEDRGYYVSLLRGGIGHSDQVYEVQRFRELGGVMVCTIAYAESFDLETCKTSYFLGYDPSLDINEQAEGRTRRAISKHDFVTFQYIKYLDTIDIKALQGLDNDTRNVNRVLSRPEELLAALKGEV